MEAINDIINFLGVIYVFYLKAIAYVVDIFISNKSWAMLIACIMHLAIPTALILKNTWRCSFLRALLNWSMYIPIVVISAMWTAWTEKIMPNGIVADASKASIEELVVPASIFYTFMVAYVIQYIARINETEVALDNAGLYESEEPKEGFIKRFFKRKK
jgi:hypothetical protein